MDQNDFWEQLKPVAFVHKINRNTHFAAPNEYKALSVSHMAGFAETGCEQFPSSENDELFEFSY